MCAAREERLSLVPKKFAGTPRIGRLFSKIQPELVWRKRRGLGDSQSAKKLGNTNSVVSVLHGLPRR
jgi:hypothetical protein